MMQIPDIPNNRPINCFADNFSSEIIILTTVDNTTTPPLTRKKHTPHQCTKQVKFIDRTLFGQVGLVHNRTVERCRENGKQ